MDIIESAWKITGSVPFSRELAADWGAIDALMAAQSDYLWADDVGRFVLDVTRKGQHWSRWADPENPATACERPEDHPWDKTREEIGFWWLYDQPCDDHY